MIKKSYLCVLPDLQQHTLGFGTMVTDIQTRFLL